MGRSRMGNGPIAIRVHERNVHRLFRQSTVAFPLQQPSPSPQDELLFKAGLLAWVHSTGTPSQRFRQWFMCFRRPHSRSKLLRFRTEFPFHRAQPKLTRHLKLKRLHYTSNHFIRQGGKTLLSLPFMLIFHSFRNIPFLITQKERRLYDVAPSFFLLFGTVWEP